MQFVLGVEGRSTHFADTDALTMSREHACTRAGVMRMPLKKIPCDRPCARRRNGSTADDRRCKRTRRDSSRRRDCFIICSNLSLRQVDRIFESSQGHRCKFILRVAVACTTEVKSRCGFLRSRPNARRRNLDTYFPRNIKRPHSFVDAPPEQARTRNVEAV